jgi:hypothetical protein
MYIFYLGTYGVSLPCEGCGGKSEISATIKNNEKD